MNPTDPRIKVYCDDQSHAPKVAIVEWLGRSEDGRVGPWYRTDVPATRHSRATSEDPKRGRIPMRCPLCGLDVEMKQETARTLVEGLHATGATSVSLGALAATLSR